MAQLPEHPASRTSELLSWNWKAMSGPQLDRQTKRSAVIFPVRLA
jgi:hypothetical protein